MLQATSTWPQAYAAVSPDWYLTHYFLINVISQASGFAIGVVGDVGVRMNAIQPKLFVGMILILIFAEAIGLFGLIVAIIMSSGN